MANMVVIAFNSASLANDLVFVVLGRGKVYQPQLDLGSLTCRFVRARVMRC
jgi:hypothetical protein